MYVNKNATLADAVACLVLSLNCGREKLSNIESIIMESPRPKDPHIIGLLRPNLSRKMVGKIEPTASETLKSVEFLMCCTGTRVAIHLPMNMHCTAPPIN